MHNYYYLCNGFSDSEIMLNHKILRTIATTTTYVLFPYFLGNVVAQVDTIQGMASYYADSFHGQQMSNGEPYDKDSMTCAHLTFPFGTMVKVRNPRNGHEVYVEVTDRGPHSKRRAIDLSKAAARELGIISSGIAKVEIIPYFYRTPYRFPKEKIKIPEPEWQLDSFPEVEIIPLPDIMMLNAQEQRTDTIHPKNE